MAVRDGLLIGRDAELQVVDHALGRLRQGYGSAIAVFGEPGIGKNRLLAEVGRRARATEVVARGSASEFEAAVPYGLLVAALDDLVSNADRVPSRLDGH